MGGEERQKRVVSPLGSEEARRRARVRRGGGGAAAAAAVGDSGEVGEREQDSKGKGSAAQII